MLKPNLVSPQPEATDVVAASCMGFEPHEIPTFTWAYKAGLKPAQWTDIEIRGLSPDKVARKFARPTIYAWKDIRQAWGTREIESSNSPENAILPSPDPKVEGSNPLRHAHNI
jgi:hypothetical protein